MFKENTSVENLQAYTLTETGKNIFKILSADFNKNYFEKYLEIIKKDDMKISYSKILERHSNGQISYMTPVIEV